MKLQGKKKLIVLLFMNYTVSILSSDAGEFVFQDPKIDDKYRLEHAQAVARYYIDEEKPNVFDAGIADLGDKDANGNTYLHHLSTALNSVKEIDRIASRNPNWNIRNNFGATPLHLAVDAGRVENVRAMINHGADVNAKDFEGSTPLHVAVYNDSANVVKYLLGSGADPMIRDFSGKRPFDYLKEGGSVARENIDLHWHDQNGNTYLHYLALDPNGKIDIGKLASRNPTWNVKNDFGATPLHLAADKGYIENVEALVRGGADINAKDFEGSTPLHVAVSNDNVPLLLYLMRFGADASIRDSNNEKPHGYLRQRGDVIQHLISSPELSRALIGNANDSRSMPIPSNNVAKNLSNSVPNQVFTASTPKAVPPVASAEAKGVPIAKAAQPSGTFTRIISYLRSWF